MTKALRLSFTTSRAASLLAPPHPPFYWHVISWRSSGAAADRHTIYDRAKQPDRSSGSRHPRIKTVNQRVSQHHMTLVDKQPSPRRGNASDNVESQVTQTTRRTYEKTERKCGSTHYVALPHTAFTGVTKLTHTPPTLLISHMFTPKETIVHILQFYPGSTELLTHWY